MPVAYAYLIRSASVVRPSLRMALFLWVLTVLGVRERRSQMSLSEQPPTNRRTTSSSLMVNSLFCANASPCAQLISSSPRRDTGKYTCLLLCVAMQALISSSAFSFLLMTENTPMRYRRFTTAPLLMAVWTISLVDG